MDSHARLVAHLEATGARFRIVEHAAEGRSEQISIIRGNHPSQALKAMVVALKGGESEFALAVLPGDLRCDFAALAAVFSAKKARFAAPEDAQRLTGCVMGAGAALHLRRGSAAGRRPSNPGERGSGVQRGAARPLDLHGARGLSACRVAEAGDVRRLV